MAEPTSNELRGKLVWISFFRVAADTVLLGATAFNVWREPPQLMRDVAPALFGLVIGVYALSLVFVAWLRLDRRLKALAWAQVGGDVAVSSALVYMTGGHDSPFTFIYSLAVVNGGVLLFRKGAMIGTVASTLALAALTLSMHEGLVPPPAAFLAPEPVPLGRLAYVLFVHIAAFFLLAALVSYLAEMARQSGEQLQARESDYAALAATHENIVRSVPSGILTIDREGRIVFMNPEAERLLGADPSTTAGAKLGERFPALEEAVRRGAAGRAEAALADAGGALHPVLVRHSELSGPGGGRVLVLEDLTRLRAMEAEIRKSEQLAALGKMAAGLAHEIRNPLASISGSIQLLSRNSPTEEDRRLMEIVLRETARLDALVTSFLAYARPSPPELVPVDVRRLVEEMLEVFANDRSAAGVKIERSLGHGLWASADPGQLRQVLWNLLLNAAQAMPTGGVIRVTGVRHNGSVRLTVADSGEGIEPADLARIFEPFFTTKTNGTGLGLAMVHRIVESHGGHVEVESERGKGARFCVVLPAVEAEARGVKPGAQARDRRE